MDNDTLIALVAKKTAVWDRKNKLHSNRNFVDKCWREISLDMKEDENKVRKKWKYLRDQFCVELGKIPPPLSEDAETYSVKWPYFKSLLFLKDIVKPRVSSTVNLESSTHNDDREFSETDFSTSTNQNNNVSDSIDQNNCNVPSSSRNQEEGNRVIIKKRKPQYLQEREIHHQKRLKRENVDDNNEDDEHLHFFKSILPHVRKIPQYRLLSFRSRMQDIVEEFAYQSTVRYASPYTSSD